VAAVLGVASVVACACSVSGSLIQDLKAGHLLGGTPWKMQVVEIVSVIVLSLFLSSRLWRCTRPTSPPAASAGARFRRRRRLDGAVGQGDRGRADGVGADRRRRGFRDRADYVRRAFPMLVAVACTCRSIRFPRFSWAAF